MSVSYTHLDVYKRQGKTQYTNYTLTLLRDRRTEICNNIYKIYYDFKVPVITILNTAELNAVAL